ncbi:formylglycine-generating enzyme family protein [Candidatus Poribacteria bacterium]|nr:formylglycine-generating enzyme family protein [Candidatus Poribacteria bacterium]
MGKFALANLFVVMLLVLFGCSKSQQAEADKAAYNRAIKAGGEQALEAYLRDYPSGQYVAQVRQQLKAFELPAGLVERSGTIYSERDNAEMVRIPAGSFQMGSNDVFDDEQPVHTVHLDAFYIDKFEVTNAQFKAFVDVNRQWRKSNIDDRHHDGDYLFHFNEDNYPSGKANHPVFYVSWYAAMAYAQWASKRLPTEAEWEKAARGGKQGKKYPWGDSIDPSKANYLDSNIGSATPVDKYSPNGYGLYNMAGNVWEWCLDEYLSNFYANTPNRNPVAGEHNISQLKLNFTNVKNSRVLRGGSWYDYGRYVRVADRLTFNPTNSYNGFGFRCARALTP